MVFLYPSIRSIHNNDPAVWASLIRAQDKQPSQHAGDAGVSTFTLRHRAVFDQAALADYQERTRKAQEASLMEIERREEALVREAQRLSLEEGKKTMDLVLEASRLASKALECHLAEVEVPRDGN